MYFVYIKDSDQHGRLLSLMYQMVILGTICFLTLHAIAKDGPDLANVHIVTHSSILVLSCAVRGSLFKVTTCTKNETI